jgi:hypothetical protein
MSGFWMACQADQWRTWGASRFEELVVGSEHIDAILPSAEAGGRC